MSKVHVGCHTSVRLLSPTPPPLPQLPTPDSALGSRDNLIWPRHSASVKYRQGLASRLQTWSSRIYLLAFFSLLSLLFCDSSVSAFDGAHFPCPPWPRFLLYEVILPWLTGVLRVKRVWDSSFLAFSIASKGTVLSVCVCRSEQEKTSKHQQRGKAEPSQQTGGRRPLTDSSHTKKHSSSLPHTCWSVLFGLDPVW